MVTTTSGPNGTQVFVNGSLLASREDLVLTIPQDSGDGTKLVIGNSVSGRQSWAGEIYGLALYDYIISKRGAAEHYRRWAGENSFTYAGSAKPILLYLFDEFSGRTVYEHAARASHMIVPERFPVLKRQLLISQIGDFDNLWNLIVDMCINTIGFIPFGFVLVVVLQRMGGRHHRGKWST